MEQPLFRQESMDRIQSPERLNEYLRVANPSVWVVLAAVIVLLVGMLIWGSLTCIDSFTAGTARVENGVMTIRFDEEAIADNVEPGMTAAVGESRAVITSVGRGEDGRLFALAETALADGEYAVRVSYKQTQVLRLLFN